MAVISAVFWGLLVLSLLVFLHEGGHFLAARACGVRVTEFFLGMPSRARLSFKSKRMGTEVGVTPILLGGYTRICGMEGDVDDVLLAKALHIVASRGRVTVAEVASGLGCDEERAYALLATLVDWASIEAFYDPALGEEPGQRDWPRSFQTNRRDASLLTEYDRRHDFTSEGSTEPGEALSVDDPEAFYAREKRRTYCGCGWGKKVLMLVAGPAVNVLLAFFVVMSVLMFQGVTHAVDKSAIGTVDAGTLAESSGMQAGDVVTMMGTTPVTTWTELVAALEPLLAAGEDFDVHVEREGTPMTLSIHLDGKTDLLGIRPTTETYYPSLPEAAQATLRYMAMVAQHVAKIVIPQETMGVLEQSSSVIGISVMAADAARSGIFDLLSLVGAISLSLGLMNLLPIPPLDGGKIVVATIELAIRRPLSTRAQAVVSYVGLAFFLFIFIVVLRNDITRLVIG